MKKSIFFFDPGEHRGYFGSSKGYLEVIFSQKIFFRETVKKIVFRGRWSNYFLELVFLIRTGGGGPFS